MDVAPTRIGFVAKDRDDLAIQVQTLFKRFLEEHATYDEDTINEVDSQELDDSEIREDTTNDSFTTTSSRQRPQQARSSNRKGGRPVAPKYAEEALLLLGNERNTLFIDFKDIEMYDSNLSEDIIQEYYRFYPYLCRALASYVREEKIRQSEAAIDPNAEVAQRTLERESIKKELDRPHIKNKDYYVGFYNFPQRDNIRDLSSTKVGVLTRVTGQVVRTHAVHPELIIGCFKCKDCLSVQYTEQQFRFTEPTTCINDSCSNRTRWELDLSGSRFTDFQRLRIQETQQELPRGCIPRSFDVVIRGADQVECIHPGDMVDFIGTLLACPDVGQIMSGAFGTVTKENNSGENGVSGLKDLGVKEMTHSLIFLANACITEGQQKPCINTDTSIHDFTGNKKVETSDFTEEEIAKIEKMSLDPDILDNLSQSLFSSIYGSDDIKRAALLQLLGGVPKQTATETKLRGDINILLVGDPSTAKSQFLKIVADLGCVKAVYASGKASTKSGLTAAVVRDSDGSFVIEAGALMLADRGICCIDEFDKMDLKDQVALHEAMEQQTISITKAGVTATLNARTSILAAANPLFGNYDKNKDLRANLPFSLPIMSRFDLFFTIIDPYDEQNDKNIAERICKMHLNYDNPDVLKNMNMRYTFEEIKLYLRFARKYYPKIPLRCEKYLVQEYVKLRTNSGSRTAIKATVRQLESLIRLSEAIARAHLKEEITPEYIRQASGLIEKAIVSVGMQEVSLPTFDIGESGDADGKEMYEGEVESQRLGPSQPTQTKLKLSLDEYTRISKILLAKLRAESENEERELSGMRRSELVDWFLHQCVGEINTENELIRKKQICEAVTYRLVDSDNILMEILESGQILDPDERRIKRSAAEYDPLIIINPILADDDKHVFEDLNIEESEEMARKHS